MSVDHAEATEITVIRGRPGDDELAAAVTVLMAALSNSEEPRASRPRPGWLGGKPRYRPPGSWSPARLARPPVEDTEG